MSILDNTETIDNYFKDEPNDKIALIDADTIAFNACLEWEYQVYDTESGEDIWHIDLDQAMEHAEGKINLILEQTGCRAAELWFSPSSKTTFRYLEVTNTYKANRKNIRYPAGLGDLKLRLTKEYPGDIAVGVEADDIVVTKYDPEKYVLCCMDKDVYNAVPGKHWNYYQRPAMTRMTKRGMKSYDEIPAKYVETSKEHAEYWPFYQCLLGDSNDGIPGCPGVGEKSIPKFINIENTPSENWLGVCKAFESKGLSEIDAVINMRLVNMHQYNQETNTVKLWTPEDLI